MNEKRGKPLRARVPEMTLRQALQLATQDSPVRRRFQFGLRSLFVLMVLVALATASVKWLLWLADAMAPIGHAVLALGCMSAAGTVPISIWLVLASRAIRSRDRSKNP